MVKLAMALEACSSDFCATGISGLILVSPMIFMKPYFLGEKVARPLEAVQLAG